MAEQPRDWDKELADIDKLIGAAPPALPAGARPSEGRPAGPSAPAPAAPAGRRATVPPWLRAAKFWPPVKRIDNAAGDRQFVCTCPPIEAYA